MPDTSKVPASTRVERQAYRMVMLMADRPDRYGARVARWISRARETREPLYNRVAALMDVAAWDWKQATGRPKAVLRRRSRTAGWTIGIGAAATAAFVFAAWRSDVPRHLLGARDPATFAYEDMARTRVGDVRMVTLRDGTTVLLDTDSMLRVHYSQGERSVDLVRGRARFSVAHNAHWPFTVYAGGGSVTARGTMFVVSVDRQIRVHLISGSVVVRLPGALTNPKIPTQQLRAGQQIVYNPGRAAFAQAPSQAKASDEQWVTGMKTFDGQSVQEVLDEVNRYTERKIVVHDPELASRKVFLDIHLRDAAESARDLADYLGVAVDTSDPATFVLHMVK